MPSSENLLYALGVKAKPQRSGMPSSVRDQMTPKSAAPPVSEPTVQTGAKASPEEACFVSAEQRCGDCSNWERDTQSCSKVEGVMTSGSGCAKYFEPMGGGLGIEADENKLKVADALG